MNAFETLQSRCQLPSDMTAEDIFQRAKDALDPIGEEFSNKYQAPMAILIAEGAVHTVMIRLLLGKYEPGDKCGEEEIAKTFEMFKNHSIKEWNSARLKQFFGNEALGNEEGNTSPTH